MKKVSGELVSDSRKVLLNAEKLQSFYYPKMVDDKPTVVSLEEDSAITRIEFVLTVDVESEKKYWELVLTNLQMSVESYVAVSTVMAVVVGIQGEKVARVAGSFTKMNWVIAALENMIDLLVHFGNPEDSKREAKLVDTSKYTFRFLTCLDQSGIRLDKFKTGTYLEQAKKIVALRGQTIKDADRIAIDIYKRCTLAYVWAASGVLLTEVKTFGVERELKKVQVKAEVALKSIDSALSKELDALASISLYREPASYAITPDCVFESE